MGYKIIEIEPEKMENIKGQVEEMLMIGGRLMSALEACCDEESEDRVGMRRGMRRGGMMGRRHGGVYSGNDLTSGRTGMRYGRDWDDEF